MCLRNKKYVIEIISWFVMFGTKFKYRPRKILLLTTFNVSKYLQYNDFFPQWESSVRENRAGPKGRCRLSILIFSKFKSYLKRLTLMTASEVRVPVSSRYCHSVFLVSSGLNEPKFQATLGELKINFIKISESLN